MFFQIIWTSDTKSLSLLITYIRTSFVMMFLVCVCVCARHTCACIIVIKLTRSLVLKLCFSPFMLLIRLNSWPLWLAVISNLDVLKLYCGLTIFAEKAAEFWYPCGLLICLSVLNLGQPYGSIWIAVASQILELPKLVAAIKCYCLLNNL